MMYKTFYAMSMDPFTKELATTDFFESFNYKECTARLKYLLATKGIAVITGNPGSGKTFAVKCFTNSLNTNLYKIIYMPLMNLTTFEFFKLLAKYLDAPIVYSKVDLIENIREKLRYFKETLKIMPIIILDEAQYIKTSMLEELKTLLNFNFDSKDMCILILIGHPSLNATLLKYDNESFAQRVIISQQFNDISVDEVEKYISSRLALAHASSKIFDTSAINALASLCNNSYRVLNNLITKCLIEGAILKTPQIDTEIVYRAKQELDLGGQL